MSDNKKNEDCIIDVPQKKPFAQVISAPSIDFSEAIKKANLKKGEADRFAEIIEIKK